jgi:hypothetical protein
MIEDALALNNFRGKVLRVIRNEDSEVVHRGVIAGVVLSDCGGYATISFTDAEPLRTSRAFAARHVFQISLPRDGVTAVEGAETLTPTA